MYITTKAISTRRRINKAGIYSAMNKYSIEYCRSLQEICSLGYSATPYKVDDIEFKTAIMQEFPSEMHLFVSPLSAKISFEVPTLRYVALATTDSDLKQVISAYMRYKDSGEKLVVCKEALKKLKFRRNGDADANIRVIVSDGVTDRTSFRLLPEFLFETDYNKIEKVSIGTAIIEQLCHVIGLSNEEYRSHYKSGKPFFTKGVSQAQEADIARSIVNGLVPLKGTFGERLTNKMIEYYSEHFKNNSQYQTEQLSFDRRVYIDSTPIVCQYLNTVRTRIYASGGKELYIDNDYAYYQFKVKESNKAPSKIYVGGYCNLSETTDLFKGIQGVYIDESDEGVPVFVENYGVLSLVPDAGYVEVTVDDLFEEYDCKNEEDLITIIKKFTKSSLTLELVLALLYARCGITERDISEVSQDVTLSAYNKCCEEAISIMRYTFNLL